LVTRGGLYPAPRRHNLAHRLTMDGSTEPVQGIGHAPELALIVGAYFAIDFGKSERERRWNVGGFGSGERWSKKDTVESRYSIDTADLKRWNLLVPGITNRAGSFEWRRGGAEKPSSSVSYLLTIGPNSGTLRLMYSMKSLNADLDYSVALVTTGCHLGGVRWWFVCPLIRNNIACGRQVRKLYLSGRYFGCRHCHKLTYRSTQESDRRVYALARAGLGAMPPIVGASVAQLGLALKALTLMEKRANRFGM
jgi:hypothetical protein